MLHRLVWLLNWRVPSQVAGAFAQPRVHGVVYDPHTGKLTKLQIDFRAYRKELKDLFELYHD